MTKTPDDNEAEARRERSFVTTYMVLSGATEMQARSVFMHVWCRERPEDDGEYSSNGCTASPFEENWIP